MLERLRVRMKRDGEGEGVMERLVRMRMREYGSGE